jgi:hypothetical protein
MRQPPLIIHAKPEDTTVRVNMPVSDDAEASYDGPVKPTEVETSDGVPAIAPDDVTMASDDVVEAIAADAPTKAVTMLEVGYRLSILKRVAEVAIEHGLRPVAGHPAVTVVAVYTETGALAVELRVLRWRGFAAWFRALAIRDFVDLKGTLAAFPAEIRLGARALLRQLTDRTHEAWHEETRTVVL